MGWLLSQCYSRPGNCSTKVTVRVGNFQAGDSEQKPEIHMRSNSKQMKKLKERSYRACLCLNSFLRGFGFRVIFCLFLWISCLRGFLGSTSSQHKMACWEAFFFKLRCKINQTNIPRLMLEKTKESKHEYGQYLVTFKHFGLGQYITIIRILWRNDRIHSLESPPSLSLFLVFFWDISKSIIW